jgi:O-antigen ligase
MARSPEEEVIVDAGEAAQRQHGLLLTVRGVIDWTVAILFFAVVTLAALPMGANRDWAWAPIAVVIGILAIAVAGGLGSRNGFEVSETERRPLVALVACFALFVAIGLFQMSTLAPLSGSAWFYEAAARVLGSAHQPVPDLAIDAARNTLLKCLTCGAIFLTARALCRDRERARVLLLAFVASAVLVVIYGIAMQVTTHSCYVGLYLKKVGAYDPLQDTCVMSGTFVSSNSFGCYCGMGIVAAMALVFAGRRRKADMPYGYDEDDSILDSVTGFRLTMLAVCLLLLGGLLLSASRAGAVATFAGAAVLTLLMLRGRWQSRPDLVRIFVVVGVIVAAVVLVVAGGAIANKMATSTDFGGDRIRIWLAALQAVAMSPWLGWGLGSFADIYAIVQPVSIPILNDLAHSTPLETVVEVGIPAALVGFAIVLIPWAVSLHGALTRRRSHRHLPAAAFAVAAVAIFHSLVDFSLQMPAIAFVVSALLGLGWAQAFGRRERARGGHTPWE